MSWRDCFQESRGRLTRGSCVVLSKVGWAGACRVPRLSAASTILRGCLKDPLSRGEHNGHEPAGKGGAR
jgi:hypothetical protein